jgi:hypothetical protein
MEVPKAVTKSGSNANEPSPRRAIVLGIIFIAFGVYPVLVSLGVARGQLSPGVQPWVGVAAGCTFILAGLAVINGYAVAGGAQANGDLSANAPFIARLTQYLLGIAIIGLMFAMFAWVAFGPGERHFSSSISIPGLSSSGQSSERSGRIVFGGASVLIGLFFVFAVVSGAKRLWRDGVASGGPAASESENAPP